MLASLHAAGARIWEPLQHFLHLPTQGGDDHHERVQLSALRIVLFSGLLLELAIGLHSSWQAMQRGMYHIVVIVTLFFVALVGAMRVSATRRHRGSTIALIATIYAGGFTIAAFVRVPEVARLGYLFCYTAPLLAGLLHGYRLATVLMLLNVVPFWMAAAGLLPPTLFGIEDSLAAAPIYVQSLLFVFFNVCLPLAAFRVLGALRSSQQRLQRAQQLYEDLFQHHGVPTAVCAADGRIQRANRLFAQLVGASGELQGVPLAGLLHAAQADAAGGPLDAFAPGTHWKAGSASQQRLLVVRSRRDCGEQHIALTFHDVTDLRSLQHELIRSQAQAEYLASHDEVTGLPKPQRLWQWLERRRADLEEGEVLPVVSCRLGGLRQINARFGLTQGNRFIKSVADALRQAAGGQGLVARTRGSVLCIALPPMKPADASAAIARLRSATPVQWQRGDAGVVAPELAFGAAFYPADAEEAPEAMHRSEVAMELARQGRPGAELSDAQAVSRRITLEAGLARAIDTRELRVEYQPKLNADGVLLGFEALVRWHSPQLGPLAPAEFVQVAEQMGWVTRITDLVLDEVCRQIARWRAAGMAEPQVAVNLSARDLDRDDLQAAVLGALERHGIAPRSLQLEVTETYLAERPERAAQQLGQLRERGIKVAIDDFGTGYSSLAKLADLPIDVLKIDRSFLVGLPGNARRERIVRSIVTLANGLQLGVVAEGVEHAAQLRFLHALGVNGFQGFLFHRPAPAEQWDALLQARHDDASASPALPQPSVWP